MNLFNKIKKSNLSWILELKLLFPTIKEFFTKGGDHIIDCTKLTSNYRLGKVFEVLVKGGVENLMKTTTLYFSKVPSSSSFTLVRGFFNSIDKSGNSYIISNPSSSVAPPITIDTKYQGLYISIGMGPISCFYNAAGEVIVVGAETYGISYIPTKKDLERIVNEVIEYYNSINSL